MVKVSEYIVEYENILSVFQHRPSDPYYPKYGTDLGLFITVPSHTLWLGDVSCFFKTIKTGIVTTDFSITATIVGKHSFWWDYSAPIDFITIPRMVNEKKSKGYGELLDEFLKQPKRYFKII